jgi:hypothetical protein
MQPCHERNETESEHFDPDQAADRVLPRWQH